MSLAEGRSWQLGNWPFILTGDLGGVWQHQPWHLCGTRGISRLRSAAGPSAHAHYLPAPSGHLDQCFSPGVLLEPEDSYLGCKQLSLWLIQPHVPPAISLVLPPDPPPPRPRKTFSSLGKYYSQCISSTNPLTTAFQSYCKASKVPQQRISEHRGQEEFLVISASLPAKNLPEAMSMEKATCLD